MSSLILAFALFGTALNMGVGDSSNAACTEVYLINPGSRFISPPHLFSVVSVSVDDGPFTTQGKLDQFDWGVIKGCGKAMRLRFRFVDETTRAGGPLISDLKDTYTIYLQNRQVVYFGVGRLHFREIPEKDAREFITDINTKLQLAHRSPTGHEWQDDRERYYGKGTLCTHEKSERCP